MTTMPGQMDARLLEQMVTLFEQQRGLLGDLLSQQQLLHHQHERVASAAGSPSSAASSIAGSFGSTLATMPSSVNIANTMVWAVVRQT